MVSLGNKVTVEIQEETRSINGCWTVQAGGDSRRKWRYILKVLEEWNCSLCC